MYCKFKIVGLSDAKERIVRVCLGEKGEEDFLALCAIEMQVHLEAHKPDGGKHNPGDAAHAVSFFFSLGKEGGLLGRSGNISLAGLKRKELRPLRETLKSAMGAMPALVGKSVQA